MLMAETDTRDTLVVASKMKKYIRVRAGMKMSQTAVNFISDIVRLHLDAAIECARRDGRKTVMDRDFEATLELTRHGDVDNLVAAEVAKVFSDQELDKRVLELASKKNKELEKKMALLHELVAELKESGPKKAAPAGPSLEEVDKRVKKAATHVVDLFWEKRVLPEIGKLVKDAEQALDSETLLASKEFIQKVRALAKEERKAAKTELMAVAREAIISSPIMEEAIRRFLATDEVKEMIDDRFRTIRTFLKSEEIPKAVTRILRKKGIEQPEEEEEG
jgi:histone H3/H4